MQAKQEWRTNEFTAGPDLSPACGPKEGPQPLLAALTRELRGVERIVAGAEGTLDRILGRNTATTSEAGHVVDPALMPLPEIVSRAEQIRGRLQELAENLARIG